MSMASNESIETTKPFTRTVNLDYSINALLSNNTAKLIENIQKSLVSQLQNKLWFMPSSVMHITIMDWVSFFPDYNQDKELLFNQLFGKYDSILTGILKKHHPITIEFNEMRATPDAIILIGKDDGSIQKIRDQFTTQVKLHPKTNPPPSIIHSTIARYRAAFPLELVDTVLPPIVPIREEVDSLQLHKFVSSPIEKLESIKTYLLE